MAYTTIDKPDDYFNTKLYTGTGSSHAITGVGFAPNWVWIKHRNEANPNKIFDTVRGVGKSIKSNSDDAEASNEENGYVSAFGSDGFTLVGGSTSSNDVNKSSGSYVAWNWKAGTSFSNSAGANSATIASTGSVNTDAGFSIISYTGNGNDDDTAKIAHGLGVAANMIIVKCRNAAGGWQTSSTSLGFNNVLQLNETNAQASGTYAFGRTGVAPTSTVFTVSATSGGNHTNTNNNTYIAYCFAEKKGYSKFGSYIANSNSSNFIYTGFKPAFLMVKQTDSGGNQNWGMFDNKRPGYNSQNGFLYANTNGAEDTSNATSIDLLSNGFQLRANTVGSNPGKSYIYMCFASNPLVTSTGVPTTAR